MRINNAHGANNQSQIFISNINVVRDLIRSLYLYGCFSLDDFSGERKVIDYREGRNHPGSTVLYDNLNRYYYYIPNSHRQTEGRYHQICFERFSPHTRNDSSMIRIYKFGAYNVNAMKVYFLALPILAAGSKDSMSLRRDIRQLAGTEEGLSDNTIQIYMKQLEEEGFVESFTQKGKRYWKLAENPLEHLNNQELADIYRMLMFFSETAVLKTPFYLAASRVHLFMLVHGMTDHLQENQIIYKRDYVFDVLDDEQMYQLLYAIHEKYSVMMSFLKQVRYDHNDPGHIENHLVIPLKMITDDLTGRTSLLMYDDDEKKADIIRLNRIYRVEKKDKLNDTQIEQAIEACDVYRDVWVASNDRTGEQDVKIRFHFDGEMGKEERIRLKNELRNGTWDEELYTVHVTDPHEMVTWIRGYCDYAEPLTDKLRNLIQEDWQNVLDKMNGRQPLAEDPVMNHVEAKDVNNMKENGLTLFKQTQNIRFDIFTYCINKCITENRPISHLTLENEVIRYFTYGEEKGEKKNHAKTLLAGYIPMENKAGEYSPYVNSMIPVLLNSLEKEAIVNALKDPRCTYFLNRQTYQKMLKIFENNEAKWGFDAVEHKNTRKGEEENDDYAELVSTLRFAIVKGYAVRYDYQGRDTAIAFHDQLMYPRFFEYTANERLRLIAWCPVAGTFLRNTVGRISNLKIDKMARKVDLDDLWAEYLKTNQKEAVLELEPNEYALERMVRLFSCYERKMTYDRKRNKLIMTVKYMADERLDIMRAILSCGDYCQVTGPFDLVEGIYERVSRALKRLEQEQMRKRP